MLVSKSADWVAGRTALSNLTQCRGAVQPLRWTRNYRERECSAT